MSDTSRAGSQAVRDLRTHWCSFQHIPEIGSGWHHLLGIRSSNGAIHGSVGDDQQLDAPTFIPRSSMGLGYGAPGALGGKYCGRM